MAVATKKLHLGISFEGDYKRYHHYYVTSVMLLTEKEKYTAHLSYENGTLVSKEMRFEEENTLDNERLFLTLPQRELEKVSLYVQTRKRKTSFGRVVTGEKSDVRTYIASLTMPPHEEIIAHAFYCIHIVFSDRKYIGEMRKVVK